jgi:hypothetical protein
MLWQKCKKHGNSNGYQCCSAATIAAGSHPPEILKIGGNMKIEKIQETARGLGLVFSEKAIEVLKLKEGEPVVVKQGTFRREISAVHKIEGGIGVLIPDDIVHELQLKAGKKTVLDREGNTLLIKPMQEDFSDWLDDGFRNPDLSCNC